MQLLDSVKQKRTHTMHYFDPFVIFYRIENTEPSYECTLIHNTCNRNERQRQQCKDHSQVKQGHLEEHRKKLQSDSISHEQSDSLQYSCQPFPLRFNRPRRNLICLQNINKPGLCPTLSLLGNWLAQSSLNVLVSETPHYFPTCLVGFPTNCSECCGIDTLFFQDVSYVEKMIKYQNPMPLFSFWLL